MKTSFSFFKNKVLTYLAIALCLVTIPLYANDSYNENTNGCYRTQTNQNENAKSEAANIVEKTDEKEGGLRQYFSDPINLYKGPMLMLGCPAGGLLWTCLLSLKNKSFLENAYSYFVIFPCLTTCFLAYGTLKTVTLGKFSGQDLLADPYFKIIARK